jgi:hypothetical protein
MFTHPRTALLLLIGLSAACNADSGPLIKDDDTGPEALDARAPWVTINLPEGGAVVTEDSSVTLTGTIDDYDSELNTIAATWYSATGSELCGASAPSELGEVRCTFTVSRDDTPVTLTANDGEFEASASLDLVVRTADPPLVEIVSPNDGGYVNDTETFTLEARVEDDNDAPNSLALLLESDLDGTLFQGAADPSGELQVLLSDLSLGDHTLTVTATDRDGFEGSASILFEVNSKPGSPMVHIEPEDANAGEELSVVIDTEAPDADGDSLSYRYTWYVDGEIVTGEVDSTLDADNTARGEEWTVYVAAADGRSVGEATSASIVIENASPEIDEAILTPDPASIADDLTCAAGTTTDIDGDVVELSYSWQVAGVVRAETSNVLPAGIALLGNSVVCTVIPTDGIDTGAAVTSNTIVIGNATPTSPEVSISPDISDPGTSDLICTIDIISYDADGDSVSYTFDWEADGLIYPDDYSTATGPTSGSETNDTVPAGDTSLAEEWTCSVTPNDGVIDGAPGTADAVAAELMDYGDGVSVSGSATSHDASTNYAQAITLASDLTVTGFGVLVDTLASSGTSARMGLYDDSSGMPGSLLVETDLEALSTGENDLDSTDWVAVTAGDYWIVVNYDASDATLTTADDTTTATEFTESDGSVDTLPAAWSGTDTSTESLAGWWLVGY